MHPVIHKFKQKKITRRRKVLSFPFKVLRRAEMKFFLYFLIFPSVILCAKKHFLIEHAVDCPGTENLPIHSFIEVNNSANVPNKIYFSGYIEVKEKITGPLDFVYEVNRCDLKAENCEKFTGMKVIKFLLLVYLK